MSPVAQAKKPPVKHMSIDETMSQDTAFGTDNNEGDTFKFDEPEETSPESLTNGENKDTDSDVAEDNNNEEQKVPYSRFRKVIEERDEIRDVIASLEERLSAQEQRPTETTNSDDPMPSEWVELYGDSEVSQRAWNIQQRREQELAERIESQAIERLERRQVEEVNAIAENEEIIDDNLANLQDVIGRKLTARQEEEILSIVDEFSPTGSDGKYVTLFPFDKAYEIFELRQAQKGASTKQARQAIANLSGDQSEGEPDQNDSSFRRGWDSWRDGI
jgi:uncharacterized membrane protein YqiK